MISSDFRIAFRTITRNKVQSAISVLGLGIGLGCIILLLGLIIHEKSFNRSIPDNKNIYSVVFGESCQTEYPLAEKMKEEFPEVKDYFRFYQVEEIQLRNPRNEIVKDQYFGFADTSFFRILGLKFITGTAPNGMSEVAISKKMALKYFGNLAPLGALIPFRFPDGFTNLSVSGVYESLPANSTLYPEFIADIKLSDKMLRQFHKQLGEFGNENNSSLNWTAPDFLSFVVLDKNADVMALEIKMEKYKDLLKDERVKEKKYYLQPVTEIYLKSTGLNGPRFWRRGNANELKYYEAISLLILIISVINYVLLTRASTSERLREMGTRKVFGASRRILRKQIIIESNIVTILSLIPAAFVIDYGMSFINSTLNKTLSTGIFSNPAMWLMLIGVVVLTGTLSGVIIGHKFSKVPAILLLSGQTSGRTRSSKWNYSFLIFHFSVYVLLVACLLTVAKQLKYSMTGITGMNPDNVIITELNSPQLQSSFTSISDEMSKTPGVIRAAGSSFVPPLIAYLPINLAVTSGEKIRFDGLIIGEGMTELLNIEIIEGSSFGTYNSSPAPDVLINESSAIKYNVKAGEKLLNAFQIKGIVKDFNSHSLHTTIQPMVILQQNPTRMGLLVIKTDGKNNIPIIRKLRDLYSQIAPDEYFEVTYLTDQINNFYENERNQSKIIGAFSILAAVLCVMGLFGIALISITKMTKEIGIRKVNGASIKEILFLLNIDFIRWVLLAIVISVPVSVYIMSEWLKRFAYKTSLSWWLFALAGVSAILVAVLTVSWQSWRAATKNPVEALRYE